MDVLSFIVEVTKATIWPVLILIIFLIVKSKIQSADIRNFLIQLQNRKFRAKFGSTEFEFGEVQKLRTAIGEIAKEPDPKKRLLLAQQTLSMESAIKQLQPEDYDFLLSLNEDRWIVTWFPSLKPEERVSHDRLIKLGLLAAYPPTGQESLDKLTSVGEAVLRELSEQKHNKSIQPTASASAD